LIDGAPIFATAVWSSRNRKTGDLLQTYIMRSDIDPREASKTGADASICGKCRHRGKPTDDPQRKIAEQRSCYVNLGQGPLQVWRAFLQDRYPEMVPEILGVGQQVRVGTYGDPAAVPQPIWLRLLKHARGHTAYTHNGADPAMSMISADTLEEAQQAWASKYRTFRVVRDISDIVRKHETLCPASAEAGYKSTCSACMLCGGTSVKAKSVAIVAHGSGAMHF
jgi:hypothetical protein